MTVTAGIISAKRNGGWLGPSDMDVLVLDAVIPLSRGGGALVNMRGELIGVTFMKSERDPEKHFSFAIPIGDVMRVVGSLVEKGSVSRGWLGVQIADVEHTDVEWLGLPDRKGVLVEEVLADGPAQDAGLENNDVIRSFDGKKVNTAKDLIRLAAWTEVGKRVQVSIIRDREERTVELQVGERPQESAQDVSNVKAPKGTVLRIEPRGDLVSVDVRDADVRDVARRIAEVLQKSIIITADIRGTVSLAAPKMVRKNDLYHMLEAALRAKGFEAVDSGQVIRVRRVADVRGPHGDDGD